MSQSQPIIAVDVDDVLAYHIEAFIDWSNEKYGTNLTLENYNDHWTEVWGVSREEAEVRALAFHNERHHRRFKPNLEATDVLRYLKKSYELIVVTARRQTVIDDSIEWLNLHYPDIFSGVHFVPIWEGDRSATKAALCIKLGASYLIDDMPKHCNLAAAEGITALQFGDYVWNEREEVRPDVVKLKDWAAVKRYFDERNS